MHPLKKLYCRTFQTVFKLAIPFLPYRSPELLHGMDELIDKLKSLKLNHVLLVTDKGIRSLGLTSRLEQLMEQNNIFCTVYDGTVANPTTDNVEEALHLYKESADGTPMGGVTYRLSKIEAAAPRWTVPRLSVPALHVLRPRL